MMEQALALPERDHLFHDGTAGAVPPPADRREGAPSLPHAARATRPPDHRRPLCSCGPLAGAMRSGAPFEKKGP